MSAEIWRSELLLYGFMILNVLGVATALVFGWRRGLFATPERMPGDLPRARTKENGHG